MPKTNLPPKKVYIEFTEARGPERSRILLYQENSTAVFVGVKHQAARWYKIRYYANGDKYILFRGRALCLMHFEDVKEGDL